MERFPIGSMYGIFTYIYHKSQPFMDRQIYHFHGSYGFRIVSRFRVSPLKNPKETPRLGGGNINPLHEVWTVRENERFFFAPRKKGPFQKELNRFLTIDFQGTFVSFRGGGLTVGHFLLVSYDLDLPQ